MGHAGDLSRYHAIAYAERGYFIHFIPFLLIQAARPMHRTTDKSSDINDPGSVVNL